jgi:hypothetical protein
MGQTAASSSALGKYMKLNVLAVIKRVKKTINEKVFRHYGICQFLFPYAVQESELEL